jgi:hypothetical protein
VKGSEKLKENAISIFSEDSEGKGTLKPYMRTDQRDAETAALQIRYKEKTTKTSRKEDIRVVRSAIELLA